MKGEDYYKGGYYQDDIGKWHKGKIRRWYNNIRRKL